jgi:hypothetical protein
MSTKITIEGLAGSANIEDRSLLDGIDCQDCFSEYFHRAHNYGGIRKENEQPLIDKGVNGGYMRFRFVDGQLYVIVTYIADEPLTEKEMDILIDYTRGQLSDGIGEGFEQHSCIEIEDEEIYLSPWYRGQILTGKQE